MNKNLTVFGIDGIEKGALDQMTNVMSLAPVTKGALMPDAHQGYGMPIGGVCAAKDALIPFAVGVDIGCRMHLSVTTLSLKKRLFDDHDTHGNLLDGLKSNTYFGGSACPEKPNDDPIMDDPRWELFTKVIPDGVALKERARRQLGTSGGGNHFVEWGEYKHSRQDESFLALLSHSGSRAMGYAIANHYTALAKQLRPMPEHLADLAWLDPTQEEFWQYWDLMNLAGDYSAANHRCIHSQVGRTASLEGLWHTGIEISNHHNFAWKEIVDGEEHYVHRKGATPAAKGEVGIIPGSMASPTYVVVGKGDAGGLNSSSHGAGRAMSRSKAFKSITPEARREVLKAKGVHLIQAGLDESPQAYKDIEKVMAAQADLVQIEATFNPRIVRMGGSSEIDPTEGN